MYFWTPLQRLPFDLAGVPLFSPTHLAWLFCALAFCALAVAKYRRGGQRRKRFLVAAALTMTLSELLRMLLLAIWGCFTLAFSLPLHLCGVMIFVELYTVLRGGPLARELCWSLGLPGALCALVTPGEVDYPFWNIFYLQFILVHTLLFLIPLLLAADGFRPSARRLPRCFFFLLALSVIAHGWNRLFGGNYLFLEAAPPGSLLDAAQRLAGPFYWPAAAALVWLLWGILYGGGYAAKRLLRKPAAVRR